jgi:uncharacterized protein
LNKTEATIDMRPAARPLSVLTALPRRIGWGSLLAVLAVIIVFSISPAIGNEAVRATAKDLLLLSPYFLAAFAMAGYAKASSVDTLITRAFRGRPIMMVFAATGLGAFTPFCSCTVVALIAVLLQSGTPLSAVMAFWIVSPVISPDLFLYTAGMLGTDIAVARLLAALFMGVCAGLLTLMIESAGGFKSPLRKSMAVKALAPGDALSPHWRFWKEKERIAIFFEEARATAKKILPWMILAIFLETLITILVPAKLVAEWVGSSNAFAIPMAILVSIPTYANPIAGVPIAKGMMALGMSKSAALAYLVAGSVTTIPAMLAVLPLVRLRVFIWHIAIGLMTGLAAAYVFKFVLGE